MPAKRGYGHPAKRMGKSRSSSANSRVFGAKKRKS